MENNLYPVHFVLNPSVLIFRGLLSLAFGVLALAWPGPGLLAIALLYGAYAFVDGIFAIAMGFQRGRRHQPWGLPILEGVLGIGVGVVTALWPGITVFVLSLFVGAWALTTGILEIIAAFNFHKFVFHASRTGRFLLGLAGVFSVLLGMIIFFNPALGAITLLTLVATYSLIFGALFIGLGVHLRREQKNIRHESEARAA